MGISKFARSLWFADINNQFEAAKKRIILLPKWRMLHSYPGSYPYLFGDLYIGHILELEFAQRREMDSKRQHAALRHP